MFCNQHSAKCVVRAKQDCTIQVYSASCCMGWLHGCVMPRRAVAYVCQNFTCQAPTSDPEQVLALLLQGRSQPLDAGAPGAEPRLKEFDISGLVKP